MWAKAPNYIAPNLIGHNLIDRAASGIALLQGNFGCSEWEPYVAKDEHEPGEKSDGLLLEHQLCFALHAAARAISSTYMETLRDAHLTYAQYLVLICLLENDGQSVSELGRRLELDSGTLTPVVKRLEADGRVARRRSAKDERQVRVFLTEKGREAREVVARARAHVVDRLGMSEREIIRMRGQLMEVSHRLRKPGPDHKNPACAGNAGQTPEERQTGEGQ